MTTSRSAPLPIQVLALTLFAFACGDKEAEEWSCEDYTMEEFWADYATISCAYVNQCTREPTQEYYEECYSSVVYSQNRLCDEEEFHACASWTCLKAWNEEVEALEVAGTLGECPHRWNYPTDDCSTFVWNEGSCDNTF